MDNAFVPYQFGYDYGIGVKSATGGRMQMGAKGSPTPIQGASGGSGGFQMVQILQTSELEDHLGISADASGGVGLFSASDRFNFARDCKIQTNSIALLLTCTQLNGFVQITQPVLDEAAAALVSNGQMDLFTQRYGDCFVAGLESGGQFFGVIRIDVRSEEDHQTIENSLSGAYGPFSADVGVKVQSALAQTQSTAETFIYYEGGNVQTKPQTPQQLFAAADEWSHSVLQAPKPYTALLLPWIIADGPNPPNAADLDHQRDVLKTCARLRSQVIDRLNLIEYMVDPMHTGEFLIGPRDADRLSQLHNAVSNDYDMIQNAASFAIDNAKQAVEPETYARTIKNLANYSLTVLPPDLPKRVDGSNIKVPDFSKAPDWTTLNSLANTNHLTLHYVSANPSQPYQFVSQDPAATIPVAAGATVTVYGIGQPPQPHVINSLIFRRPAMVAHR
ncbi:MAG TPA: hypothetical protein VMT53_22680 [Terriglobales bacterium]|nr:hypothetical protein [Terriglobales bacterium]